jgi:hypothetical protein
MGEFMDPMNKFLAKAAIAAAVTLGTLATAGSASAFIACNREGDCWHTEDRRFDRGLGIVIHPDDWYFHQRGVRPLREFHSGRGYWRGGVWIGL